MKTNKTFEIRYALNLDISSFIEGSTEEEAIEKLKAMSAEELCKQISDSIVRNSEVSDISVKDVESADCYFKVKVIDLQFFQMDADDLKKEPEDEILDIHVYDPRGDVDEMDIREVIEEKLWDIYHAYPRVFNYEILETL